MSNGFSDVLTAQMDLAQNALMESEWAEAWHWGLLAEAWEPLTYSVLGEWPLSDAVNLAITGE